MGRRFSWPADPRLGQQAESSAGSQTRCR